MAKKSAENSFLKIVSTAEMEGRGFLDLTTNQAKFQTYLVPSLSCSRDFPVEHKFEDAFLTSFDPFG